MNMAFKFAFVCIVYFSCFGTSKCEDTKTSLGLASLFEVNKTPKVSCETHANCSSRILTLDTYCCQSNNQCCNWFEFAATYRSESSKPTTLKAPSILTILAILLLIICFLFVSYCFSILFCFCFKCGIFKRPKVVILSQLHDSESGLFTSGNNSPKHSTSTTSSATSSSSYLPSNRRHHRHISPHKKHNSHKKSSQHKHRHRSTRSPTARTYANKRPQYESEIYVDFDSNHTNESPFLIPPELNDQVQERLNGTIAHQDHNRNHNSSSAVLPSAPLALDDNEITQVENHSTSNNRRNNNILEPVVASSLSTSTSSSLGFGASMQAAIEASNQEALTNSNNNQISTITSSVTNNVLTNFHYHDEKPPAYDDIIKNDHY